jgi:hypothetical protein
MSNHDFFPDVAASMEMHRTYLRTKDAVSPAVADTDGPAAPQLLPRRPEVEALLAMVREQGKRHALKAARAAKENDENEALLREYRRQTAEGLKLHLKK